MFLKIDKNGEKKRIPSNVDDTQGFQCMSRFLEDIIVTLNALESSLKSSAISNDWITSFEYLSKFT